MLKDTNERIIFFSSLFVKLIFFFLVLWLLLWGKPFSQIESDGYLTLASNLYHHAVFSDRLSPPYVSASMQVPGYPLFLVLFAIPFQSVVGALLIQIVLVSFSAILLYRLLEGIFPERVCFWGALLFAIEPWNAFSANSVLSESLFIFSLVAGIFFLRKALVEEKTWSWFVSGLLIGLSAFIRPISLYLGLLAVFGFFLFFKWREALRAAFLFALGFFLIVGGWSFRNYKEFGTLSFATKGPHTLYFYDVEQFLVYRDGISAKEADSRLFLRAKADYPNLKSPDELNNVSYSSYLTKSSVAIIREAPFLYIKMHLLSLGTFFFSDGYRLLLQNFGYGGESLPNLTLLIARGDYHAVMLYLREGGIYTLAFLIGFLFWFSSSFLAFVSLPLAFATHESRNTLFTIGIFIFIVLYFAILTGPVAQARYRVPITPFLFPLLGYSVWRMKHNREKNQILHIEHNS